MKTGDMEPTSPYMQDTATVSGDEVECEYRDLQILFAFTLPPEGS